MIQKFEPGAAGARGGTLPATSVGMLFDRRGHRRPGETACHARAVAKLGGARPSRRPGRDQSRSLARWIPRRSARRLIGPSRFSSRPRHGTIARGARPNQNPGLIEAGVWFLKAGWPLGKGNGPSGLRTAPGCGAGSIAGRKSVKRVRSMRPHRAGAFSDPRSGEIGGPTLELRGGRGSGARESSPAMCPETPRSVRYGRGARRARASAPQSAGNSALLPEHWSPGPSVRTPQPGASRAG